MRKEREITDGYRLKELIEKSGMSYKDVEKKTGIPDATLNRWANSGVKEIPLEDFVSICTAVGADPVDELGIRANIEMAKRKISYLEEHINEGSESERAIKSRILASIGKIR